MIWTVIALFFAYAIIEPMRFVKLQRGYDHTSISSSIMAIKQGQELRKDIEDLSAIQKISFLDIFATRQDVLTSSASVIYHKDTRGLEKSDPNFLRDLISTPIYAIIPRFLWNSKPEFTYGLWVREKIHGLSRDSSSAIGVIGYLYLVGNFMGILVIMFFLGFVERIMAELLLFTNNMVKIIVYLSAIPFFMSVDIFGLLMSLFREIPILLFLFTLIFRGNAFKWR
jgi:hypothetical protein